MPLSAELAALSSSAAKSSALDTATNNSAQSSFTDFVPAVSEGFDPQDYEEVKRLAEAQFGHVFLWQHRIDTSKKIVVKRISNNADSIKKNQKRCHSQLHGEDPFTEFGATLAISGLSREFHESSCGGRQESDCPFLPHTYGCWRDSQYTYLASEYCTGGELFNVVQDKGSLPEEEVKAYVRDVLCAVRHLHSHGIAHRDISLENILLGEDGRIRLIDLGAAHELHRSGTEVPARGMVGKDMYRAPEMYPAGRLAQKDYAADKVDIWEVGQCAFILLVGKPLWVHPNEVFDPRGAFDYSYKNGLAKLFQHWRLPLSQDASSFIQAMLHMDPERRPTAGEALCHPWLQDGRGSKMD